MAAMRADAQRFVFTSSIAVYGRGQVPMTEEMVPYNIYGERQDIADRYRNAIASS